jgi:Flp pilus assembly protein TadD
MAELATVAGERGADSYGRAAINRHLARRHIAAGEFTVAVDLVTKAVEEYRRTGAAVNEAHSLSLLAEALIGLGEPDGARLARRQAHDLLAGMVEVRGDDRRLLDELGRLLG